MKYGLEWDKYSKELTLSKTWSIIFVFETVAAALLLVNAIVSLF
jgi:hypothetical protein